MAANTTHVHQVGTVFVPVSNQERALDFYVNTLGFEKRADFPYSDGYRWIEIAPPGSTNTFSLVPPAEGRAPGSDVTRCAFVSADIKADHAALKAAGVDVDAEIARKGNSRAGLVALDVTIPDPMPSMFFFRDPDGNRFLIVG